MVQLARAVRHLPPQRTGMAVSVVNSYAATALSVPVSFVSSVDLPTDGNPMSPTRVSPLLLTSNPSPGLAPPLLLPAITSDLSFAILAFKPPKWRLVGGGERRHVVTAKQASTRNRQWLRRWSQPQQGCSGSGSRGTGRLVELGQTSSSFLASAPRGSQVRNILKPKPESEGPCLRIPPCPPPLCA